MLSHRPADLTADRDFLLEMHCLGNYESDTPWARARPYVAYREEWLRTPQPQGFLDALRRSLAEARTIAEVWEEDGRPVGFLWVGLTEIEGYAVTVADVNDIEVAPQDQRRGIGTLMLQHAEALARERGAQLMRSETGIENEASQALHARLGFDVYRLQYEKALREDVAGGKP